jgi:hypothetical protein
LFALCNFVKHYNAMLQWLREVIPRVYDGDFTGVRVREMSIRLIYKIQHCTGDPVFRGSRT